MRPGRPGRSTTLSVKNLTLPKFLDRGRFREMSVPALVDDAETSRTQNPDDPKFLDHLPHCQGMGCIRRCHLCFSQL